MNIVLATPLYPPEIGGPATHAALLARDLPARGIGVEVLPFSRVRRLPSGIRHACYAYLAWRAALRADAVVAEDAVSVGFPAMLAARFAGRPFIVRVPGDHAWEQGRQRFGVTDGIDAFQTKRYGSRVERLRRIERRTVNGAARVVVPSEYFAGIVRPWLANPENLRVIYNGIEATSAASAPSETPPHPCMVMVGRLVPWKGFDALIRLLPALPRWSLVIVGEGPGERALRALAETHHVADRVHFAGRRSREEVCGWYEAADAFVHNASFESFSYQIAEALRTGAAIIATRTGSIPELVADGVEGVLVEEGDDAALSAAIESVAADPDAWDRRRAAAKQKAKRFSDAATADAFAALILDACKR